MRLLLKAQHLHMALAGGASMHHMPRTCWRTKASFGSRCLSAQVFTQEMGVRRYSTAAGAHFLLLYLPSQTHGRAWWLHERTEGLACG